MSPEPIHLTLGEEWAQLVNRLGAQLSKNPEEVVAFALRHLDLILNIPPGSGVTIRKSDSETDLTVEKIVEKPGVTIHCSECGHGQARHVPSPRSLTGLLCSVTGCSCTGPRNPFVS